MIAFKRTEKDCLVAAKRNIHAKRELFCYPSKFARRDGLRGDGDGDGDGDGKVKLAADGLK